MDAQKHYDAEYVKGPYVAAYEQLPAWAAAMNQWHVDFVIALLNLSPAQGHILDLGSGMGHYLTAWETRGFRTFGREISEVAITKSGRTNITRGDAADLSSYKNDQFQLVFSAAFLEHVDDDAVAAIVREQARIARYGAHFIAHEKGTDPGHINIKSQADWFKFFCAQSRFCYVVANPLVPVQPAFLHMREMLPHLQHSTAHYGVHSGVRAQQ